MATTLRDQLSAALDQAEAAAVDTTVDTTTATNAAPPDDAGATGAGDETAEQREQRARDQQGRFARSSQQRTREQQGGQQAAPAGPRKPPSSWKKDYWQHWEKLGGNPELAPLQEYIEQRETDYAKGVSTYKAERDAALPLINAIQPFMPELQAHGIRPDQWISNLGAAHRTLAMGNPQQKLQMFAKLAVDYGVPLQALVGGRVDPQAMQITQTVSELQREMQSFRQQQDQAQQAALQQHIDAFTKNAPHFEAVRGTMAELLQSGLASDLQTAYDKAIWMHDDVRQQVMAQQAAPADRQRALDRKRAAAASPRSSSPTGAMGQGGAKKSLRDHLSEAFENVDGGRF